MATRRMKHVRGDSPKKTVDTFLLHSHTEYYILRETNRVYSCLYCSVHCFRRKNVKIRNLMKLSCNLVFICQYCKKYFVSKRVNCVVNWWANNSVCCALFIAAGFAYASTWSSVTNERSSCQLTNRQTRLRMGNAQPLHYVGSGCFVKGSIMNLVANLIVISRRSVTEN